MLAMSYTIVVVKEGVETAAEGSPAATWKDAKSIARKATDAHPGAQIKVLEYTGVGVLPKVMYNSAKKEHAGRIDA